MKKIIASKLAIIVLIVQILSFGGLSLTAFAENTTGSLSEGSPFKNYVEFWYDDFEKGIAGQVLNTADYITSVISGSYLKFSDEKSVSGSNSIKFEKNTGTGGVALTKSFTTAEDILLEVKVWTQNWVRIDMLSGSTLAGSLYVRLVGTTLKLYYHDGNSFQPIADISAKEWNTLRIETDNASGIYSVYKNGDLMKANVPMVKRVD